MPNQQLSETLKQLRKATGLSQDKVANELGFKKSTLGSWESAVSEPDAAKLMKLLHFYRVQDIYALFNLVSPGNREGNINEKLNQLNEENRMLIELLINKLLAFQNLQNDRL